MDFIYMPPNFSTRSIKVLQNIKNSGNCIEYNKDVIMTSAQLYPSFWTQKMRSKWISKNQKNDRKQRIFPGSVEMVEIKVIACDMDFLQVILSSAIANV